jgi:transketolase
MRKTFINTLVEEAEKNDKIYLICPDIGYSVLEVFKEKYPTRFLNVGIAEQNAVSIAAGLALVGYIPYVYTIMPFMVMRPYEQIRVDIAYMNTNVRIIGVGAGFSYGAAGATHHSLEDIALMRVLPGMTVICPGDPWEVQQAIKKSVTFNGPMYFRLGKQGEPILSNKSSNFEIGKASEVINGDDLYLLSTSNTLEIACQISKELLKNNLKCCVTSFHTIKPFDYEYISRILVTGKPIYTIEEHYKAGGFGSLVSEIIAESGFNPKFKMFCIEDRFSHYVGSHDYLRRKFGFSVSEIVLKMLQNLMD